MKHPSECKKIILAVQIDGQGSHRYIKCDLSEHEGRPIAVLFWPSPEDNRGRSFLLDPHDISTDADEHGTYTHTGNPIPLPKDLAEMRPAGLSDDAFRLGFFFLPDSPSERT